MKLYYMFTTKSKNDTKNQIWKKIIDIYYFSDLHPSAPKLE